MTNDLLLLSNSAAFGRGHLEHAREAIVEFLGAERTIHFAPFALADNAGYTAGVQAALVPLDVSVAGLHAVHDVH